LTLLWWRRTPSDPPCSQDRPKLTHIRVPPIALACCLAATAATLVSNRADARALAACSALRATSWNQPVASREKYMCGRYRLAPRVRPSRLPRPQGTGSCGPPRCLRDAASRLGLFQRHRWRLRVREEPSVLLLDSSGAIGGVLELPDDDYFISTAAEGRAGCLPGRSNRFLSAWSAACCV
jgi:hypothetical protein